MNIASGRKVVASAGTAERLSSTNLMVKRVVIVAETDNTNPVTVGGSDVVGALATRKGIPLAPVATGESRVEFCNVDLYTIFIDAVTSSEGVTFTYEF